MTEKYPLDQVIQVKQKRLDDAERAYKEKLRLLEVEQEKLKAAEQERDKAKETYSVKLADMRAALDAGKSTTTLRQKRDYLKLVKEKLLVEEGKVKEQMKMVDTAQKNADLARRDMQDKRKELEKMQMHKEEWQKEAGKEVVRQEGHEQDELGTSMFLHRKRPRKEKP